MPFDPTKPLATCTVCRSPANLPCGREMGVGEVVDCSRCGDFHISNVTADEVADGLPIRDPKKAALASHLIRKMQRLGRRPTLDLAFFTALSDGSLPNPAEASDNLIRYLAQKAEMRPGALLKIKYDDPEIIGTIGVISPKDMDRL